VGIPVLFQAPLAFVGCLLWHFLSIRKERQDVRNAFGFFLPDKVIDNIVNDLSRRKGIHHSSQMVFGTVLCSDGEQYTKLAERMKPRELNIFLNQYYEAIFAPVNCNNGTVSDLIGDSMLAVWATAYPDRLKRLEACRAALEVIAAVDEFNERHKPLMLSTRIGLHYGELMLGTVGGFGHYEYRPIGDVVNTASRIENLNKHFKTRILVSEETIDGIDNFVTREMGYFQLSGKTTPVAVYEIICALEDCDEKQKHLVTIFSEGLRAFEKRHWDRATDFFREYLKVAGNDTASSFYLGQCEMFKVNPPSELWDGIVSLGKL
jgi:adenylate cyclase